MWNFLGGKPAEKEYFSVEINQVTDGWIVFQLGIYFSEYQQVLFQSLKAYNAASNSDVRVPNVLKLKKCEAFKWDYF